MFDDVEFYWKHKAEIYRQNYEDALDEVRELRFRIKELETENHYLARDLRRAEKVPEKNKNIF